MNRPKMNPAILRLLVIFPNVLSYMLLFGIIVFVITNYSALKANDALTFWFIIIGVLGPSAFYTTYAIITRIRAGVM